MYEEFVESFKAEEDRPRDDGGVKSFVHGGVAVPGSRTVDAGNPTPSCCHAPVVSQPAHMQQCLTRPPSPAAGRKAGSKYTPSFLPPAFAPTAASTTPGRAAPGSPGRPPRAEAFTGAEDDEDEVGCSLMSTWQQHSARSAGSGLICKQCIDKQFAGWPVCEVVSHPACQRQTMQELVRQLWHAMLWHRVCTSRLQANTARVWGGKVACECVSSEACEQIRTVCPE